MFGDSMLETSWAQRTRRSWTTSISFGLQALIIGLLLLLPVLRSLGLPSTPLLSTPITLGRRSAEPSASTPRSIASSAAAARSNFSPARLVAPGRVPRIIAMVTDDPSSQPSTGSEGGPPGPGFFQGAAGGLPSTLAGGTRTVLPTPPPAVVRAVRTSFMLEGNLIRRVQPIYPPLARSARVQGPVVLAAIISKAGTIENLHALSGHPLLVSAAIDAVSQWRYRPYILNSEAIEVETQITVNFSLAEN
jgi:protein TonB